MNWRKNLIFAGLYLTGSKVLEYLKEIERIEKLPQEEIKINRGNFEANLIFLKKTGLLTKDKKILEIGSGKGAMVDYLSKEGYDITGTEINEEYTNFAKNNFDINLEKMSRDNLEFEDESFDLVISFDVFEHIPNTAKHLQEVKRVLKPSGYYLLQTPNKWTNLPFEIIKNRSLRKHKEYHCSLHNYWQIKNRFEKKGFCINFYEVPVVNDFFKKKIKKQFGLLGLIAIRIFNPDLFPYFLRTNFYLEARRQEDENSTYN